VPGRVMRGLGRALPGICTSIFRFCRRALPTREDAEDATMEIS